MNRVLAAVLISGGGSNMDALLGAAADPDYPADIRLVISNRPEAGGLAKARSRGIEAVAIDHRPFGANREAFEAALQELLAARGIGFIALAGFMRILTPGFVGLWRGRMINIHPSLLPRFKGLDTHARALAAGAKEHGCTVHWVTPELDGGAIIAQARVPVMPDDDARTLAARVLAEENSLYPMALAGAVRSLAAAAP
ncbi:MAG: phosphoribosylglycinamide formyltransferase [Hyphomicrobiales bacterium]|nr:phosphoribosylglycinamide formyltransferase [Hyphomicrobiales bacterium]